MKKLAIAFALAATAALAASDPNAGDTDPYLWLSDIHGARALAWVKEQTAKSDAELKSDPVYKLTHDTILRELDVKDRIPLVKLDHGQAYNFWQDKDHVRGIWRVTSVADYAGKQPHWQLLLDVDKLDAEEKTPFVWQGADCNDAGHCLIRLSPGGGDATTVREFDLKTRSFVKDGFALPRSKLTADWLDADHVIFGTDFGAGSMTTSSYPRILKVWTRGTPISAARQVFEAGAGDIQVDPRVFSGPYGRIAVIQKGTTFFTNDYFLLKPDLSTVKLPLPPGAVLQGVTGGFVILTLRDAWNGFAQGALIAFDPKTRASRLLYAPNGRSTVEDVKCGRDACYAAIFENVVGTVHRFAAPAWKDEKLAMPAGGSTAIAAVDDWGPQAQFTFESYLTPPTLYATDGKSAPRAIKSQAPVFDASHMAADQAFATSADGTKVPYFLIHPKGSTKNKNAPLPTILYSYGGFELSLFPIYWNDGHRPLAADAWVGKGGAIAIANIRGGGEFGPAWHQAALGPNRQRAFDDFAAVAKALETRGVTTPAQLGIVGASNGGVLTTVTMTQHPELLRAVVSQRPLVDMLRYTRFGAGQSWVAEYGDPAIPEQRAWIEKYSAYQKVTKDMRLPSWLGITETSDDRVTPIWARMMAAKMEDQGHDVLFNESSEGGHGPGATSAAQADMWGLTYAFFARKLGLGR